MAKQTNKKKSKVRLFIKNNGVNFLILSLMQEKDGSIYASWPDFSKTVWPFYQVEGAGVNGLAINSIDDGKLSIHGSGLTGFRGHQMDKHRLSMQGHPLLQGLNLEKLGVRHLFTFFPNEPQEFPANSPCFNRKSDLVFLSSAHVMPFMLVLLAIPIGITKINLKTGFKADNYRPEDFLGSDLFSLRFHQILWFMYKNYSLINWPKQPHCIFHDGHHIPFLTGLPDNCVSVEYLEPIYNLEDKTLTVIWSQ